MSSTVTAVDVGNHKLPTMDLRVAQGYLQIACQK